MRDVTRLGIDQLSVFGLPPLDFVDLAASLGCDGISIGLTSFGYNPHGYTLYSLRDDVSLRRELIQRLRERGIAITLGEGFTIRPSCDILDLANDLDLMAELGAERVNAVSMDPDLPRTLDQLAIFAEAAAARGLPSTIEPVPILTIADLDAGMSAVRHVGRPDFALLLDAMHLARSGATGADIAALERGAIGYFQLCDAQAIPAGDYMQEAMFGRVPLGAGAVPIVDYLSAIPDDIAIGIELPLRDLAERGIGPADRLRPAVETARAMISDTTASQRR